MMPKELLGSPFQNPNRHQSIRQVPRAASLQREGEDLRKRSIMGHKSWETSFVQFLREIGEIGRGKTSNY